MNKEGELVIEIPPEQLNIEVMSNPYENRLEDLN